MNALYIVALGEVEEEAVAAIEMRLWDVYGFEIKRLPAEAEPAHAFDKQRGQLNSSLVLRKLLGGLPADAVRLLGLAGGDLFIPMLSFVFGQAQLNGPAAVVSLARLRQEFYSLPANRPLMVTRAVKEAVHEIGHTFGLTHCSDNLCPMSLSNTVRQVDAKGETLCGNCSIILNENTKHIRAAGDILHGARG